MARTDLNPTIRSRWERLFAPSGVFFLVTSADQALKYWCGHHLRVLARMPLFGQHALVLSHYLNRGIAGDHFSAIPNGSIEPYTRYVPTAIAALLVGVAVSRYRIADKAERVAYALLLGGGISNLWDHWHSEFVIDTFQAYRGFGEAVPFNLADIGVVAGSVMLIMALIRELKAAEIPRAAETLRK